MSPARSPKPAAGPAESDAPIPPGDKEIEVAEPVVAVDLGSGAEADLAEEQSLADQEMPSAPDAQESRESAEAAHPDGRPGSRRLIACLLGAVTVALGSFGIWATVRASDLHAAAADTNAAIVDRTATAAVSRQVTQAVQTIFSYSYADIARTRASAQRLLSGAAVRQYDQLFTLVEQQAPKQKLVVTTRVTSLGVEFLAGGRARVLVFVNQQDARAGTKQTSYGGAMFAVTAVDQRGTWKIVNIDTFTGPQARA